jgi:hypothetical protein
MDALKPLKQLTGSLAPKRVHRCCSPPLTSVPEATHAGIETCSRSIPQIRAELPVLPPSKGKLAAVLLMEIVESWAEIKR